MLHGDGGPPPAKRARQDSSEDAAFAAAAERAAELGVLKAELVRKLSSAAPLWGVDEQALQLARVLDRSLDDASNEVVLLAGHRGSGKTATLEQVLAASGADSDAGAGSSSSSSSGSSSSSSANASSSASSGAGASSRGSRFRIVRLHGQLHQKMDPNNNNRAGGRAETGVGGDGALARGAGLAAREVSGQLGLEVARGRHFTDSMATVEEAMKVRGQHKRECQHQ